MYVFLELKIGVKVLLKQLVTLKVLQMVAAKTPEVGEHEIMKTGDHVMFSAIHLFDIFIIFFKNFGVLIHMQNQSFHVFLVKSIVKTKVSNFITGFAGLKISRFLPVY